MGIDMTPTREGYTYMLKVIAKNSTSAKDRAWAKAELKKIEKHDNLSISAKIRQNLVNSRKFCRQE